MADQGPANFLAELEGQVLELGFAPPRITRIPERWDAKAHLQEFIKSGNYGDMQWMPREAHRRQHPHDMWPEARSAVVLGLNYGPDHNPLASLAHASSGNISVYARGADYHDLIKKRLKKIAGWLHRETGEQVKVFVDTAPLMEKPLAQLAGLGWQGKHTNLVSREFGSWLLLGVILSAAELPVTAATKDHCGTCTDCLDICPTKAFIAPRKLDASACISYLTIEHQGHIPAKFRAAIGNRIYGCDDCLAVCPWNKYAQKGQEAKLHARPESRLPSLDDLARLDEAGFRQVFTGSPLKRTGRNRMLRNILIAIGNSGDASLIPAAKLNLQDASPLVRAMAVWALGHLLSAKEFAQLRGKYAPGENDPDVQAEWTLGTA